MDELSQKAFDTILHKDLRALSETDKAFLRARKGYLTPEQQEVYKEVLSGKEPEAPKQPDLRKSRSYRALQAEAKELGFKVVGVSREELERDIETAKGGR